MKHHRDTDAVANQRALALNHKEMNRHRRLRQHHQDDKRRKCPEDEVEQNKVQTEWNAKCQEKLQLNVPLGPELS